MKGLVLTPDGWEFHSDKRRYSLYEGKCIDSKEALTSDILYIMDDLYSERNSELVGWMYGAGFITDPQFCEEWEKNIRELVELYETKENMSNVYLTRLIEKAKEIQE